MKTFPMFLKMAGRRVVILGGGEQAAQKARLMLKTEGEIVVVATVLEPELAALAAGGRIVHAAMLTPGLCDAFTPSIVDRDPLVVAIGAEGTALVLARQAGSAVETMLEPRLGELTALSGRLRDEAAARIAPERRRAFRAWGLHRRAAAGACARRRLRGRGSARVGHLGRRGGRDRRLRQPRRHRAGARDLITKRRAVAGLWIA